MIYCDECGNRVYANGVRRPTPICGKCLMTPWEIRQRELRGCLSLAVGQDAKLWQDHEHAEAEARRQRFERTSARVHRSRFHIATKVKE